MAGGTGADAGEARNAARLIEDAFGIYRRYPLLFLTLAAAVVVPWRLIEFGIDELVAGSDVALLIWNLLGAVLGLSIAALVSSLHIQAVSQIGDGEEPVLGEIAAKGVRALPVVAFVSVIAAVGVFLGMLALFVPGVLLAVRLAVVAQAAAIEQEGWWAPLRRSFALTRYRFWHVFALLALVFAIVVTPEVLIWIAFGLDGPTLIGTLVSTAVSVLTWSFGAVALALLYYDLRLRLAAEVPPDAQALTAAAPAPSEMATRQASWDPRAYTDGARPAGWYVEPVEPGRMKYWTGGAEGGWSGTTRTPRKIRRAWRAELPDR